MINYREKYEGLKLKSQEKVADANAKKSEASARRQEAKLKLSLANLGKAQIKSNVRLIQQPIGQQQQVQLSQAQNMLNEILGGGERTWGTGQNLPRLNKTLNSGGGLIKNGDIYRETGGIFGLR